MSKHNLYISNSRKSLIVEITKLVIFMLLMLALFFGLVCPQYQYEYTASIIDKVKLLKETNEPKIILVGNSNLAFGIRSNLIEDATGMKAVNLGIQGSLGNAFLEEIAKININQGDIVVVCHNTYDSDDEIANPALEWITVENHVDLYRCVPKTEWHDMLLAFPTYVRKCIDKVKTQGNVHYSRPYELTSEYSRFAFNEYGDDVYASSHDVVPFDHYFEYDAPTPVISNECINRLNLYNEYIKEKGATLVIAAYPIAYGGDELPDAQKWDDFKNELQSQLDAQVISDYKDYWYPCEYFFGGGTLPLHMTEEGAIMRTSQLIDDLQNSVLSN